MKNTKKQINKLKQCLHDKGIALSTDIYIKLNLLENALNDYFLLIDDIESNGIIIDFNNGKTKGLNPCYKAKIMTSKLILKLLSEIGLNAPKSDEDIEDAQEFINYLTS
jgi:phage terminase small subunit